MLSRPLPALDAPGLTVRPIHAGDKAALLDLFERLGDHSRVRRFFVAKPRLSPRELVYFTEVDHHVHEALVAVAPDGAFAGVARYACAAGDPRPTVADIAFAVADAWQGRGIGSGLARMLVEDACRNGMAALRAMTLPENRPARKLLLRAGFKPVGIDGGVLEFELDLAGDDVAAARRAA